jgi:hypothetical protein
MLSQASYGLSPVHEVSFDLLNLCELNFCSQRFFSAQNQLSELLALLV